MGNPGTLHDAFIDELRDAYDAEKQLTKALPKMARAASSPDLRAAFEHHLEETRGQIERLEQVFESLDEKVRGKHCDGIAGIIDEGKSVMQEDFDEATMDPCLIAGGQRAEHYEMAAYGTLIAWAEVMGHTKAVNLLQQTLDACLIASGQRAEHYEMAAYGTLVAWARAMGHDEAAGLLEETLQEEKAADQKLTQLAEGGINREAADLAHPERGGNGNTAVAMLRRAKAPAPRRKAR